MPTASRRRRHRGIQLVMGSRYLSSTATSTPSGVVSDAPSRCQSASFERPHPDRLGPETAASSRSLRVPASSALSDDRAASGTPAGSSGRRGRSRLIGVDVRVIEVDVRDHGDRGFDPEERVVVLVRLDDHQLAPPRGRRWSQWSRRAPRRVGWVGPREVSAETSIPLVVDFRATRRRRWRGAVRKESEQLGPLDRPDARRPRRRAAPGLVSRRAAVATTRSAATAFVVSSWPITVAIPSAASRSVRSEAGCRAGDPVAPGRTR
jgi:hypothetical protein